MLERLINNEAVITPMIAPNASRVPIELKPSVSSLPVLSLEETLEISCSIKDRSNPADIVTRLIDHTLQLTKQGRGMPIYTYPSTNVDFCLTPRFVLEYFREKAQKQLPKNFMTLTGKMDHASVIALKLPSIEQYHEVVSRQELQIVQREIAIP